MPLLPDVANFMARPGHETAALRSKLTRMVFKQGHLPTGVPAARGDSPTPPPGLPAWDGVSWERWESVMGSYNSVIYCRRSGGDDWAVVHGGHVDGYQNENNPGTVKHFIDLGYNVLCLQMPGFSENKPAHTALDHTQLFSLETASFCPMRLFVEPVVQALNLVEPAGKVAMTGVSGGGWTTTLCAALDTRIRWSFPVSGSWPLWVGTPAQQAPGNEQTYPWMPDYTDLYAMACDPDPLGRPRRQVQVLNYFDPCCYFGDFFRKYRDGAVAATGGAFDVMCDNTEPQHHLSDYARRAVVLPCLGHGGIPQIVDNHPAHAQWSGAWLDSATGRNGSMFVASPSGTPARLTWHLTVPEAGDYLLAATFTPWANQGATNAPFSLAASGGLTGQAAVNQKAPNWGFSHAGSNWVTLFQGALPEGPLDVTLSSAGANGYVLADSLLLKKAG